VRTFASSSFATLVFVALVGVACAPKPATTPTPTTAAGQQPVVQGQYPQQQGQYPQQQGQYPAQGAAPQGYAQPAPQGYPQQGAAPAPGYAAPPGATTGMPAPAPGAPTAAGAPMATPGPLALPCSNDQACGLAHCNTQYGKCAFPCQSATDCIQGASCNAMTGFCLPGGG
jgi:hypothetical protein